MQLLVTGGAGFIGSHLVDRLLADGCFVTVLDNFDPFYDRARKEANLAHAVRSPNFRLIEADITDAAAVSGAWAECRPDVVVHLAAKAGVRPSIEDPLGYAKTNIDGTLCLLEQAKRQPDVRFIFGSSSSVYGDRAQVPFREHDNVDHPVSPYAATKRAGELLCHTYHHLYGIPITCLRFFTVYGPRNRPDLAVAKFTRLIDHGAPIPFFGDGSTSRDYTYVDDTVDGVLRAIERCQGYAIYNLGNSSPVELRSLVDTISKAVGKEPKLDHQPMQPGDVRQTFADVSLAEKELGYRPLMSFMEGIRRYVEWYSKTERLTLAP